MPLVDWIGSKHVKLGCLSIFLLKEKILAAATVIMKTALINTKITSIMIFWLCSHVHISLLFIKGLGCLLVPGQTARSVYCSSLLIAVTHGMQSRKHNKNFSEMSVLCPVSVLHPKHTGSESE